MSTFCLVHGAFHGAWCFERLVPELEALGHVATAIDLPSDEIGPTFSDYASVVADALGDAGDVVLVGHSLAGMTIPLVAARRPVRRLVFLAALLPIPGRPMLEQMKDETDMLTNHMRFVGPDDQGRAHWPDPERAIAAFYADCDPQVARWAAERLRPQARSPHAEPFPLDSIPDLDNVYVLCRDDRSVNPEWSRRVVPERLGIEPTEMDGGHSPFLARPAELARLLDGLA
jgi:pimeloyl-ACP methyl ester carboxylesterase